MTDIVHRVAIQGSSQEQVINAIATPEGISGWWIDKTTGEHAPGGILTTPVGLSLKVLEPDPVRQVRWNVVEGPDDWLGTTITFGVRQDGEWTVVMFAHEGWRERTEFVHHCSTKWATFLVGLKEYVETGAGRPHPDHDVTIGNWR